ncbi:MAG: GtrA family protein [Candidatus Komeilibacteria bacterium]
MTPVTIKELLLPVLNNWIVNYFRKIFWEAFRFATAGLITVIIDFSIFISLTRFTDYFGVHYLQANMIAFLVAVIVGYFINKYWTFKHAAQKSWPEFVKYIGIMIVGSFIIAQSILYISVEILHIYDLIGKIIGVIIGYIWNFFNAKYIVFKN